MNIFFTHVVTIRFIVYVNKKLDTVQKLLLKERF